ncbi:MAG: hypothetical protein R2852_02975 [Bacteroidia bacterium]
MIREKVENPPIIDLFLLFSTYGGLLLVILTAYFWKWSGLTLIGALYLFYLGPIVMGSIALINYRKRKVSNYHLWTFRLGLLYFIVITFITLMF